MFRRLWAWVVKRAGPKPCERCGQPSRGFHSAVEGKLHTTDPATGHPVTKYCLGPPRRLCSNCLRAAEDAADCYTRD